MKQVDVQDQVRLGLAKSFELCISGIKYRLFRSLVTVATVALAVAFLMTMLGQSVIRQAVQQAVEQETAPRRHYLGWLSRLSEPMSEARLSETLWSSSDQPGAADRLAEARTWGALDEAELGQLRDVARREKAYLDYFRRLDEGNRAMLLGAYTDRGSAIFYKLAEDAAMLGSFQQSLTKANPRLAPELETELGAFLNDYRDSQALRQRVLQGHGEQVAALRRALAPQSVAAALATADAALAGRLAQHGYVLSEGELESLAHHAAVEAAERRMSDLLKLTSVRSELASRARVPVHLVSLKTLFEQTRTPEKARDLLRFAEKDLAAAEAEGRAALDPETMALTSQLRLRQAVLTDVEARLAGEQDEGSEQRFMGFSRRTLWLIVVSFGVCAVGIANAMLMSVTERFREIATMKCLGAMDGFIMMLFVLESCLQGLAGGLAGAAVGVLLGLGRSAWEFGGLSLANLPPGPLAACAGISLVSGVLLAALAAVYPSWVASRLAPMEAMRVE